MQGRLLAAISAAEAEAVAAPAPAPAPVAWQPVPPRQRRPGSGEQVAARHLRPVVTAVEMVFGSAAALSATFGLQAR